MNKPEIINITRVKHILTLYYIIFMLAMSFVDWNKEIQGK